MKTFIVTAVFLLLVAGPASAAPIYDFVWTAEISSPTLLDENGHRLTFATAGVGEATLESGADGALLVEFVSLDGSGWMQTGADGALTQMALPSCCGVTGEGTGHVVLDGDAATAGGFSVEAWRVETRGDVYVFSGRGTRRRAAAAEPGAAWLGAIGLVVALGGAWLRRPARTG